MSTPEERAARAAYMRGWTQRNRDRVNEEGRKRYASDERRRARVGEQVRIRVLRERGGTCDETTGFVPVLYADPCAYCGVSMVRSGYTTANCASLDHIDPQGDSRWMNLAGCCSSCNARKGKMPLLLSLLETQLRRDLTPIAEQLWLIKGRAGQRRRIDF